MKEIISLGVTLIKIVVMSIFGCIYNTVWDQLCGCLDELPLLVGDIKLRAISLDKVKG